MAGHDEQLDRWQQAGLLDETTVARIRAFEAERARVRGGEERPGILEAIIYLGIAIVVVGASILVGSGWDTLEDWARIAVLAVPGLLALGAGFALRSLDDPGFRRGGHLAWLAATVLLAAAAGVAAAIAGWEGENVVLTMAIVATVLALALWVLAPSHPQLLGIAGALATLGIAVAVRSDEFSFLAAGCVIALFGLVGIILVELGLLRPRRFAEALSALAVAWGAYFAGLDGGPEEALAFVAAALLIALSIWRGVFLYIVVGVGVGFIALVTSVVRHTGDPTTASLTLILAGAVLVGVVVLLARVRPWRRSHA